MSNIPYVQLLRRTLVSIASGKPTKVVVLMLHLLVKTSRMSSNVKTPPRICIAAGYGLGWKKTFTLAANHLPVQTSRMRRHVALSTRDMIAHGQH